MSKVHKITRTVQVEDIPLPKDMAKFASDIIISTLSNLDTSKLNSMLYNDELHIFMREIINQSLSAFVGVKIPEVNNYKKLIDESDLVDVNTVVDKFNTVSFGNEGITKLKSVDES